ASSARESCTEIRTTASGEAIRVKHGRAIGVALATGDELDADEVISTVDPRLTFLRLLDAGALPPEFLDEVRRYRFRGSSGKVNFALDALPDFTCLPGAGAHLARAISVSPSLDYMAGAYAE